MENKMDESKKCYMCVKYIRYYTKGVKEFKKTKFGWCCESQTVISAQDGCEEFKYKAYSRRRDMLLKYTLNDLLTEISEIRKLLQDGSEDEEL